MAWTYAASGGECDPYRDSTIRRSALHDDPRSDARTAVEVDPIVVGHPDAAGRDRLADRLRLVRAMDAVKRAGQIHGAGAEWVVDAARHVARQVGAAAQHLGRRAPIRPLPLHADRAHARPREPWAPDADRVLNSLAPAERVVEAALGGRDHDRARSVAAAERDHLARDGGRLGPVGLIVVGLLAVPIILLAVVGLLTIATLDRLTGEGINLVSGCGRRERGSRAGEGDKGDGDATHGGLKWIVSAEACRFQAYQRSA